MGNFKHQSLRERDRDRDADKERDKDGNERLRHVSCSKYLIPLVRLSFEQLADKYDRDRLLPLPSSRKDSNGSRAAPSNGASRRSEAREAAKKKVGESTEDWRRGKKMPSNVFTTFLTFLQVQSHLGQFARNVSRLNFRA